MIHSSTRQSVYVCIVRARKIFLLTVETAMLLHDKGASSTLSESRCFEQFRASSGDSGFSVLTEDDCIVWGVLRCVLAPSTSGCLSLKLMSLWEGLGMVPLHEGILWLSHLKQKASKTARHYLYSKVGYKDFAGKQMDSVLAICQVRSDGLRAEKKERGQLTLLSQS